LDENHYELQSKNGRCPYLQSNNQCKIYKVRPLVCTTFPVYLNEDYKNNSKYEIIPCPLAKTLSKKNIEEKKKQIDMVEKIIKTTFSSSKLPKKDLKLIEKRFNRIKRK
jgi:Fe-S-cluster containining protein